MSRGWAPDGEILKLDDADDVTAAVERIYGDTLEARGLIQAVEAWHGDRGRYVALAAGRQAPRSHHGCWASNLVRARADAILTTGSVLRRVPTLDHRLKGPGRHPQALAAWRWERLRKRAPPVTLVLTSDAGLDLDHPVFRHWTRPVVYTSRRAEWQLESRAVDRGVEVVGVEAPTVEGAVEFLRLAFGTATIAVEADPAIAVELYGTPPAVDEVMLSVYHGPRAPADAVAAPFLTAERLARAFPLVSKPYRVATEDGEWSLHRFRKMS